MNKTPAQKRAEQAAKRQSARDKDWSNRTADDQKRVREASRRQAQIRRANRG